MIFYIDWRSRAGRKALDEFPFLPLAMAEATEFYRKQERGRFKFEDLLTVATEALVTSKGVNYAKKAIRGALLDFARDDHKLVRNVEMTEAEYLRTRDAPAQPPAATKHGKVSVAIKPTPYDDGFSQERSGQVHAKIEADEQEDFDPRAPALSPRGAIAERRYYVGRGRKQRFQRRVSQRRQGL